MYLPYLGYVSAEQAQILIGGLALLSILVSWYRTGRFALIGHLLRLAWFPVRAVCWVAWLIFCIMSPPGGGIIFGIWFVMGAMVPSPGPLWWPEVLMLGGMAFYARRFRAVLGKLWRWQPRSQASPPPPKPKAAPVVRIAAKGGGRGETERRILRQLPPHLQALIQGAGRQEMPRPAPVPPAPPPVMEESVETEPEEPPRTGTENETLEPLPEASPLDG